MALELAFIVLTLITNVFLVLIGFKAINTSSAKPKKDKAKLVLALIIWQGFIWALSAKGVLESYDFPPLFALAFIVPSFIFTGAFLYLNRKKNWIQSIPEPLIIYFQSFRIMVELLFVFAFAEGIFNAQVTIEGYNFDMVFAFTAPILAYLVYTKKLISRKVVIVWNYIGLAVLASVIALFMISLYRPEIFGSQAPLMPLKALSYPYNLIAGFLMPTAVFLHVLSLVQVYRKRIYP